MAELGAITDEIVARIRAGAVVVYPTDTVYGIGCVLDDDAVERVYEAKGREEGKPMSIAVPRVEDVARYALLVNVDTLEGLLPGAVTVVLPCTDIVPDRVTAGGTTIAVRVPDHPLALELVRLAGPLVATSANKSGMPAATTCEEARRQLGSAVDIYIDGGPCGGNLPSTVVDLVNGTILREGAAASEVREWMKRHWKGTSGPER